MKRGAATQRPFWNWDWQRVLRGFSHTIIAHDRTGILSFGALVAVNEFNDRHRGCVRSADTGLHDADIAAVPLGITRCQNVEQLDQLCIIKQPGMGKATVRKPAFSSSGKIRSRRAR